MAKSFTREHAKRMGRPVAIFFFFGTIPHMPGDHIFYCFYIKVHCSFHDLVFPHIHMADSGEWGWKWSLIKEDTLDIGQITSHLGQQSRSISRLMALEHPLHEHREFCLTPWWILSAQRSTWSTADKQWRSAKWRSECLLGYLKSTVWLPVLRAEWWCAEVFPH